MSRDKSARKKTNPILIEDQNQIVMTDGEGVLAGQLCTFLKVHGVGCNIEPIKSGFLATITLSMKDAANIPDLIDEWINSD